MISIDFKVKQPNAYRVISNAFKKNTLGHAYLFTGEKGTPKTEFAYYIAQSLVCENKNEDGLACGVCDSCRRVTQGNFADIIYVDGINKSIKIKEIEYIKEKFSKTGLEATNKKIYILDGVENISAKALNALLKFLEEPEEEVIAILTCESEERILPTIISRTQKIAFYKNNVEEIKNALSESLSYKEAYVLAHIASSVEEANNLYKSEEFKHALYLLENYLEYCVKDFSMGKIFMHKEGFPKGKRNDKKVLSIFLDLMILLCRDLYRKEKEELYRIWDKTAKNMLLLEVDKIYAVTMKTKDKMSRPINIALLVDQFLYEWEV